MNYESGLWDGDILENHVEVALAKHVSAAGTWVQIQVPVLIDHLTTLSLNFLICKIEINDTSQRSIERMGKLYM